MSFTPDPDLFPFASRFHRTANGANVHYVDEGEGRPILMLHGNPTWSFLYRKLIKGLSADYRCIAVDYPGFGLSEAPAGYDFRPESHARIVRELVQHLDLQDAIVVVQDWGGPIGLAVAQWERERFGGLVIGNTWGWPMTGNPGATFFSWALGGPLGRFADETFDGVFKFFMKGGHAKPLSEAELAMYAAPLQSERRHEGMLVFPREIVGSKDFLTAVEGGMRNLSDKPVLILWADKDFGFGERELNGWRELFPEHTYYPLDAGHYWQDDDGDEAAKLIGSWLASEAMGGLPHGASGPE